MLSIEVPETDQANAKQAIKEAQAKTGKEKEQHELECKAEIICKAQEYLADVELMKKLKPFLDKKVKALKGIAGLKQKLSDAQMREMKKGAAQEEQY